jgi:Zn-dependent protease with chaperone function
MNLALLLAGLALVALPGWTVSRGHRLAPREWARLTVASLSVGLLAVRLALVVTAVPVALHAAGIDGLLEVCHQVLGPIRPGHGWETALGIASAVALGVIEVRMWRARRSSRQARRTLRVESWIGHHTDRDDHELVVIPTTAACAYALDGQPPQVVVSDGLADSLSSDELAAVIAHERCHLQHRHHRHLELAVTAEAALGRLDLVRRSSAVLRLALERWADEEAAHQGSRAAVRGALEKVVGAMLWPVPIPAFTGAETIRQRLDALGHEPQAAPVRYRLAATLPAALLIVAVGIAAACGAPPVHRTVFSFVGYCVSCFPL